ncbi:MAG TPA: 5'-3' exonuclease H3TH domain-containing protein [Polyangiaceae bacterium]
MSADIVLFDTFSLLFRAFHALPSMCTTRGFPTSALYGFCSVVIKVLREQKPRGLSFAVDAPVRTFRAQRYAEYKAGRQKAPSELVLQLDRLDELLEAFGAPAFCVPGFEADDVLATLVRRLRAEGSSSLVVSGDRDLLQLVDETTRVLFMGRRGKDAVVYDEKAVEGRFGVAPAKLPTFVALVGDASDNLQGVPGIGPKTAAELVVEFGSVATLLEKLDSVRSEKLRESLRNARERLIMNEDLARLRDDVSLDDGPLALPVTSEALARLRALFEELEFKSLILRLEGLSVATERGLG